jgi:hypothetical protein
LKKLLDASAEGFDFFHAITPWRMRIFSVYVVTCAVLVGQQQLPWDQQMIKTIFGWNFSIVTEVYRFFGIEHLSETKIEV